MLTSETFQGADLAYSKPIYSQNNAADIHISHFYNNQSDVFHFSLQPDLSLQLHERSGHILITPGSFLSGAYLSWRKKHCVKCWHS